MPSGPGALLSSVAFNCFKISDGFNLKILDLVSSLKRAILLILSIKSAISSSTADVLKWEKKSLYLLDRRKLVS